MAVVTLAALRFGGSLALFGVTLVAGTLLSSPDREPPPPTSQTQAQRPAEPAAMIMVVAGTAPQKLRSDRSATPSATGRIDSAATRRRSASDTGASPTPSTIRLAAP